MVVLLTAGIACRVLNPLVGAERGFWSLIEGKGEGVADC